MSAILALDPGPTETGFVYYVDGVVREHGTTHNTSLRASLGVWSRDLLAVEMIASYGMPVGREVFETCVWIGRFIEAHGGAHRLVYRKDVKLHLCGTSRAKDANIRQALIDAYGGKERAVGRKASPGPLYGVKSHAWPALAVAVTAAHQLAAGEAA